MTRTADGLETQKARKTGRVLRGWGAVWGGVVWALVLWGRHGGGVSRGTGNIYKDKAVGCHLTFPTTDRIKKVFF